MCIRDRLTDAVGGSTGNSNAHVYTTMRFEDGTIAGDVNKDGIENESETWLYHLEYQKSGSETENSYVVIRGQAVMTASVSTTWALDRDGKRIAEGKHGFNRSETIMTYSYNGKGQLLNAVGHTRNDGAQEVLTTGDGDAPNMSACLLYTSRCV